jgi:hypothetical protein
MAGLHLVVRDGTHSGTLIQHLFKIKFITVLRHSADYCYKDEITPQIVVSSCACIHRIGCRRGQLFFI